MKNIILILSLLLSFNAYSQDLTVVHFNYKWNSENQYRGLDRLRNVKVQYAYVEDQSELLQKSIKSVPTIIIYKDGKPAARFEAGLQMRITAKLEDLQELLNKLQTQ
tara:strand:+ start:1174 stop:1494 length:321 start_codon:yes stop_codon:yes gene_type:complete